MTPTTLKSATSAIYLEISGHLEDLLLMILKKISKMLKRTMMLWKHAQQLLLSLMAKTVLHVGLMKSLIFKSMHASLALILILKVESAYLPLEIMMEPMSMRGSQDWFCLQESLLLKLRKILKIHVLEIDPFLQITIALNVMLLLLYLTTMRKNAQTASKGSSTLQNSINAWKSQSMIIIILSQKKESSSLRARHWQI